MIVEIKTKIPTVNNAYPRNLQGRRFLSKVGKAFKLLVAIEVRNYLWEKGQSLFPIYSGRVYLGIKSYFMRKGRDRDNPTKLIQDALKGTLYKDDSQVYSGLVEKEDDKDIVKYEKLEIEFYEMEDNKK